MISMRFIPTFILEHWIYKKRWGEGVLRIWETDGKLYGMNLCKIDKDTDVYRFETRTGEWIKIPKEVENEGKQRTNKN